MAEYKFEKDRYETKVVQYTDELIKQNHLEEVAEQKIKDIKDDKFVYDGPDESEDPPVYVTKFNSGSKTK